jgi:hypothetical protein
LNEVIARAAGSKLLRVDAKFLALSSDGNMDVASSARTHFPNQQFQYRVKTQTPTRTRANFHGDYN